MHNVLLVNDYRLEKEISISRKYVVTVACKLCYVLQKKATFSNGYTYSSLPNIRGVSISAWWLKILFIYYIKMQDFGHFWPI